MLKALVTENKGHLVVKRRGERAEILEQHKSVSTVSRDANPRVAAYEVSVMAQTEAYLRSIQHELNLVEGSTGKIPSPIQKELAESVLKAVTHALKKLREESGQNDS